MSKRTNISGQTVLLIKCRLVYQVMHGFFKCQLLSVRESKRQEITYRCVTIHVLIVIGARDSALVEPIGTGFSIYILGHNIKQNDRR